MASVSQSLLNALHGVSTAGLFAIVGALVFGETALFVGFVLPGETAVLVGGALASQDHASVVLLCVVVVLCAAVGDSVGYFVGHRWGEALIAKPIFDRRRGAIDRALNALERRGAVYVFIGRFTAVLRALMPGLAGMSALPYRRFLIANVSGAIIWGTAYTIAGYTAGKALATTESDAGYVALGVLVVVVVFVAARIVLARRRRAASA